MRTVGFQDVKVVKDGRESFHVGLGAISIIAHTQKKRRKMAYTIYIQNVHWLYKFENLNNV